MLNGPKHWRNAGAVSEALRLRLDGYGGLGGELALRTLTLCSEATNCTLIPRPRRNHVVLCQWLSVAKKAKKCL